MVAIQMDREARMLSRKRVCYSDISTADYVETDTTIPHDSEELYRRINKVERGIGGDAGIIGMSGSVARLDMARILKSMAFDASSHFLDIGSGLGRPMLHALQVGAAQVSGIEFDIVKHKKSQTVINRVLPICEQTKTCLHHADILTIKSLTALDTNISHIFSFWEGITIDAREAVGKLVSRNRRTSRTVSTIAFVQSHVEHLDSYMKELYFPSQLKLVDTFPVSMIGSAAKFKAYIFALPPRRRDSRVSKKHSTASLASTTCVVGDQSVSPERRLKPLSRILGQSQAAIQTHEALRAATLLPDEIFLGDCIVRKRKLRSSMESSDLHPGILDMSVSQRTVHSESSAKRKKAVAADTQPTTVDTDVSQSAESPTGLQGSMLHTEPELLYCKELPDLSGASTPCDLIDLSNPSNQTTPFVLRYYPGDASQACEVINISPNELICSDDPPDCKTFRERTPDSPTTRSTSIFDFDLRSRSCSPDTTNFDEPVQPCSETTEDVTCPSTPASLSNELAPAQMSISLADLDIKIVQGNNRPHCESMAAVEIESQFFVYNTILPSRPPVLEEQKHEHIQEYEESCTDNESNAAHPILNDHEITTIRFPSVDVGADRAGLIKSLYG